MAERRQVLRRPTQVAGKIVLASLKPVDACTILDISSHGARIELAGERLLPPGFHLLIPSEGLLHRARLKWRQGRILGVEFEGDPVDLSTTRDPRFTHLAAT